MATEPLLLTADAVAPMGFSLPPILRDAGVVVANGVILGVGERPELRRQFGELPSEHHPGVLLPGLINAHTHLELSYQSADALRAGHFTAWVAGLMKAYPRPEEVEAVVRTATQRGVDASLAAGVTTVGDVSRQAAVTRAVLARSPLRAVSFGEVTGLGTMRGRADALIDAAMAPPPAAGDGSDAAGRLTMGLSPHAPYTVEGPTLRKVVRRALLAGAPVCMHLAELAEEEAFLRDLSGPLGRDWDVMKSLNVLDDAVPTYGGGPIRWAQLHGLLVTGPRDLTVLLAHVNYCDDAELDQLAAGSASVVYCPRTHAYFGHPPTHRYRDMLDAGVNVCLGTDSLASNPDLSVRGEAQLLCTRDGLDPQTALELITRRAALGLGLDEQVGTLEPGKQADLLAVRLAVPDDDAGVFRAVVTADAAALTVWAGGERVR